MNVRTRDLIETYKIPVLTGKEDVDRNQLFQLSLNIHSTRGHHLKLSKKPYMFESFSSLNELWMSGNHQALWNLHPSTRLRTDWMTTSKTRKLCYSKDDRAMRPTGLHGCPENFRVSLTTPTATIPNIFHGLLFGSTL